MDTATAGIVMTLTLDRIATVGIQANVSGGVGQGDETAAGIRYVALRGPAEVLKVVKAGTVTMLYKVARLACSEAGRLRGSTVV